MRKIFAVIGIVCLLLAGCGTQSQPARIAATTLPVYEFTSRLCQDTDLTVTRLVTESVSCLHDYSLNVSQVKAAEAAELVVISGAGLEDFMADILEGKETVDASTGIALLEGEDGPDAHIWLSPENALVMAENICRGLSEAYPQYQARFAENLAVLQAEISALQDYAQQELAELSCRELVTFHDGFAYLADAYDLTVLAAIEEESGSEASAAELKQIISLVEERSLPAVFVETNGSISAAQTIASATGVQVATLDMAMAGDSWLDAMYQNIDTLKEVLK